MHCCFRNNANSETNQFIFSNMLCLWMFVVWLTLHTSSPAKRTFIYCTILVEYWACFKQQHEAEMWLKKTLFNKDMIWFCLDLLCRYSFCVPPKLDLHVRPKLGEREVTFCHVTEWIEKKLQDEFQVRWNKIREPAMCSAAIFLTFLPIMFPLPPESVCTAKHGRHLLTPDALQCGQP